MTNAEIANQLRHKAADLHALADQLDPPVSVATWTPVTTEHAASLSFADLIDLANHKQTLTGNAFTPQTVFESQEEFIEYLIGFVTT